MAPRDTPNRAMFLPLDRHATCKRPDLSNSFVPRTAIGHDTRKLWDFCKPAAVHFAVDFDCNHERILRHADIAAQVVPRHRLPVEMFIVMLPLVGMADRPGYTASLEQCQHHNDGDAADHEHAQDGEQ